MASFDELEASAEDSSPREFITISYGSTTHRLTTAIRELVVNGVLYSPVAAARGEIVVQAVTGQKECTITLPIDHAFVRRYLRQGIPPGKITATIVRQQSNGLTQQQWSGEIDGMSVDDDCTAATFRIVSTLGIVGEFIIPSVNIGRGCPHVLFEGMCGRGLSRDGANPDGIAYKLSTSVLAVDGRNVRIDLTNVPAGNVRRSLWCTDGEFVHAVTGERRTIRSQQDLSPGTSTLTQLSLYVPIVEMKVGDTVEVYPGCNHAIRTTHGCGPKFGNRHNYGGLPQLPTANPFTPGSSGMKGL